jgi:hypothetical protein
MRHRREKNIIIGEEDMEEHTCGSWTDTLTPTNETTPLNHD